MPLELCWFCFFFPLHEIRAMYTKYFVCMNAYGMRVWMCVPCLFRWYSYFWLGYFRGTTYSNISLNCICMYNICGCPGVCVFIYVCVWSFSLHVTIATTFDSDQKPETFIRPKCVIHNCEMRILKWTYAVSSTCAHIPKSDKWWFDFGRIESSR